MDSISQTVELFHAVEFGHENDVRKMLDSGANGNASIGDETALMLASSQGYEKIVRLLIEHGADVNASNDFGVTALMMAVRNRHADIVRALLDAGADVAQTDSFCRNSLDLADIYCGCRQEISRMLLDAGAVANELFKLRLPS